MCTETWLKEGEDAIAPKIAGYHLRHVPRPSNIRTQGGGVGFYHKCELPVRVLNHPITGTVEQMWLQVSISCKKVAVGTAYRPPWLCKQTFLNALSESISSFSWHNHIILLGDSNINLLTARECHTLLLNDLLSSFDLHQFVTEPTHFSAHVNTLLDLVCTYANVTVTMRYSCVS